MVSGTISLLCSRCFSPFLHSTCSLSVSQEYLALPDGPGGFSQDSSCPDLLRITLTQNIVACKGLSPAAARLSSTVPFPMSCVCRGPTTPQPPKRLRFGLLRFRSPLLAKSRLFSSPAGTKMFQFPAFASVDSRPSAWRVYPFGNSGIKGYLHLPRTYRSLSRPSSPLRA